MLIGSNVIGIREGQDAVVDSLSGSMKKDKPDPRASIFIVA